MKKVRIHHKEVQKQKPEIRVFTLVLDVMVAITISLVSVISTYNKFANARNFFLDSRPRSLPFNRLKEDNIHVKCSRDKYSPLR